MEVSCQIEALEGRVGLKRLRKEAPESEKRIKEVEGSSKLGLYEFYKKGLDI